MVASGGVVELPTRLLVLVLGLSVCGCVGCVRLPVPGAVEGGSSVCAGREGKTKAMADRKTCADPSKASQSKQQRGTPLPRHPMQACVLYWYKEARDDCPADAGILGEQQPW